MATKKKAGKKKAAKKKGKKKVKASIVRTPQKKSKKDVFLHDSTAWNMPVVLARPLARRFIPILIRGPGRMGRLIRLLLCLVDSS